MSLQSFISTDVAYGDEQTQMLEDMTTELEITTLEIHELEANLQSMIDMEQGGEEFEGVLLGRPLWLKNDWAATDLSVLFFSLLVAMIVSCAVGRRRTPEGKQQTQVKGANNSATMSKHNDVGASSAAKGQSATDCDNVSQSEVDVRSRETGASATVPKQVRIAELWIYPVKSCRGIPVQEALVTARGFKYDRHWLFVSERGRFLTQRREPKLTLITPVLTGDSTHDLPLFDGSDRGQPRMSVGIWSDTVEAIDQGDDAAEWIREFLEKNGGSKDLRPRLVRMAKDVVRPTDEAYASGFETGFADGFPFLVASKENLAALNPKLETKVDIRRFRPKCKMTTIFPDEGRMANDGEPLQTLKTYRLGRDVGYFQEEFATQVLFGQNAVTVKGVGRSLRTGDIAHPQE